MADININKPQLNKGTPEANIALIDTWIADVADKLNSVLPNLSAYVGSGGTAGGGGTASGATGTNGATRSFVNQQNQDLRVYINSEIAKVNSALLGKQGNLLFDDEPKEKSGAVMTSGAIYNLIQKYYKKDEIDKVVHDTIYGYADGDIAEY